MTLVVGLDSERPPRFTCRLYHCEATAARDAIMCRKHWRVVPARIQSPIRRLILGTQVDPRRNQNPTNRWRILCARAVIAVLEAQGKTDAMNDELTRLARLDPKSATAPDATGKNRSKRSDRGKPPAANGAS